MPRKPTGTSCYLDQRADSPYWYICEWDAGSRQWRRKSTRTADHGEAQKILAQYILALGTRVAVSDATVLHVVLRYWTQVACKNEYFARHVVKRVLALVTDHLDGVRIFDWPTDDQRTFIAKLGQAKSSQRRYWGVIRTAANWMASDEIKELPSMPALVRIKEKDVRGTSKAVRPLSVPELKLLFGATKLEHEQRLLLLCLVTDHRPGAVLELTWDRIDLEHGFADLNVPGRPVTNKRRGIVPLSTTVVAYLRDRRSIGPVIQWGGRGMKQFQTTFERLVKAAGIKGSAYGVRKGTASYLRSQGISLPDIKAMLAHSLGGETDQYAHYDPSYMAPVKAAMERLLAQLAPHFLASYLPVKSQATESTSNSLHSNFPAEDWTVLGIQQLDAANADSYQLEETST